jgi:hypothetical protein
MMVVWNQGKLVEALMSSSVECARGPADGGPTGQPQHCVVTVVEGRERCESVSRASDWDTRGEAGTTAGIASAVEDWQHTLLQCTNVSTRWGTGDLVTCLGYLGTGNIPSPRLTRRSRGVEGNGDSGDYCILL